MKKKKKFYLDVDGSSDYVVSQSKFSDDNIIVPVEPDQSMTIRQIFDNWTKGRPTTVHPLDVTFDDDADDVDFENENPIDMSQVENDINSTMFKIEEEKAVQKEKQRQKKEKKADRSSLISELSTALAEKLGK